MCLTVPAIPEAESTITIPILFSYGFAAGKGAKLLQLCLTPWPDRGILKQECR